MMKISEYLLEIMVRQPERSLEFYEKILGFQKIAEEYEGGNLHWVKLKNDFFTLSLKESTPESSSKPPFSICIQVENIQEAYANISLKMQTLDTPHLSPCGIHTFSIQDPDGYIINFECF